MKTIIHLGITPGTPLNISERIKLSNKLCLLFLLLNTGYLYMGLTHFKPLLAFVLAAYGILVCVLFLNFFRKTTLSRFILSVYLTSVCAITNAALDGAVPGKTLPYPIFCLIFIGAVLPFILFTHAEKKILYPAFGICAAIILGFEPINRFIQLDAGAGIMHASELDIFFSLAASILIAFFGMNFLLNAEQRVMNYNEQLHARFNEKNEEHLRSEKELTNYLNEFKKAKVFEEQINWQNVGVSELAQVIRKSSGEEEVFRNVITFICKYTGALKGILYVFSHRQQKLFFGAGYGATKTEGINDNLSPGETLAGQCMKEQKSIHLTNIPEDYIAISSGLGDASPKTVILLPVKNDHTAEGVLELAFFKELAAHELEFLNKITDILTTVIFNEKNNRRTSKILEQLRTSNNEIVMREEELRQNLEELSATQEEMSRAQKELETKEAYLRALIDNTNDSIMEIDTNYKIVVINQTILNRYKGTPYEGINVGVNPLDYFDEDLRKQWKAYYDRGLSGEQYTFVIKSVVKGENIDRHYNINPVKDKEGKIIGVSVFSRDVAMMKG